MEFRPGCSRRRCGFDDRRLHWVEIEFSKRLRQARRTTGTAGLSVEFGSSDIKPIIDVFGDVRDAGRGPVPDQGLVVDDSKAVLCVRFAGRVSIVR